MKTWTIRKRIVVAFTVLVTLLLAVVGLSLRGSSRLEKLARISKESVEKEVFITERQLDHVNWVHGLDLYLTRDGLSDPALKRLLSEIGSPHKNLHNSARRNVELRKAGATLPDQFHGAG